MSLLETIRSEMTAAMKGGPEKEVTKTILRQVISEAQRLNITGDEDIHKVIRKLVEGNEEAMRIPVVGWATTLVRKAFEEVKAAEDKGESPKVEDVVRKLVEGNLDGLKKAMNPRLALENEILQKHLPRMLHIEEIRTSLTHVADEIRAAKSSGQATGVAMKYFKLTGSSVNGKDVAMVIEEIRGVLNENQPPAS
jgi:uncharacterized protein YqeY